MAHGRPVDLVLLDTMMPGEHGLSLARFLRVGLRSSVGIIILPGLPVCDTVQGYLTGEGYRVSIANDGVEMRRIMAQGPVDLADLMLPGEEIIILTGRGEILDRIILEMGVDDYLPKPFHLRALLHRVKRVLHRASTRTAERQAAPRSRARFGGWYLDLASRELLSPSGEEVRLTAGEFDLLAAFVNNANQGLTRDQLLDLHQLGAALPVELVAQGCGWGWHRVHWRDHWGYWH